jgi:hypothetical protein
MANEYMNLNAARPDWQGPPGLAGMTAYDDQQRYNTAMALRQRMNEEEFKNYMLDNPVRAAERPAKTSGFDLSTAVNTASIPYADRFARGKAGEADQQYAKGQVAVNTIPSETRSTDASNTVKALEAEGRQMELHAATSPLLGEQSYQAFKSKLPPQLQQRFPPNYTPEVPKMIEGLSKALTNSPAHRGKMAEIVETGTQHNQWAKTTADANERARMYAADRALEAAWARMGGRETQQKVEGVIKQYLDMKMQGQKTTPDQDRVFEVAQQIMTNVRSAASGQDPTALRSNLIGVPAGRQVPPPVPFEDPAPQPGPSVPRPGGVAQHSLGDLRKMYPGKSDDELKAAYRRRFNMEPRL